MNHAVPRLGYRHIGCCDATSGKCHFGWTPWRNDLQSVDVFNLALSSSLTESVEARLLTERKLKNENIRIEV